MGDLFIDKSIKNKPTRGNVKAQEDKKSKKKLVGFSESELKVIEKKAKVLGLNAASYIRFAAINAQVDVIIAGDRE